MLPLSLFVHCIFMRAYTVFQNKTDQSHFTELILVVARGHASLPDDGLLEDVGKPTLHT